MDFLDDIFEKLKEVGEACRKIAWKIVALASLVLYFRWFFFTWLPARSKQFVEWVIGLLPNVGVDLGSVAIPWDRVNQFVPVNETIGFVIIYVKLACAIAFLKWIKKFTFW